MGKMFLEKPKSAYNFRISRPTLIQLYATGEKEKDLQKYSLRPQKTIFEEVPK